VSFYYYNIKPAPGFRMSVTKRPGDDPQFIVVDLPEDNTRNIQHNDLLSIEWIDDDGVARAIDGRVYFKRLGRVHVSGYATVAREGG